MPSQLQVLLAPGKTPENVPVSIGTLPAGKSVTIKYRVTVDNPMDNPVGALRILNQGTVSGIGFPSVTTTDPSPNPDTACLGAGTKTCTPIDRPDTTVTSINLAGSSPTNVGSVSWTVTYASAVNGLTSSNFSLINIGLTGTPAITDVSPVGAVPATTWVVTASAGSGDGTLGLNMVNDSGFSHDTTNLLFTGQVYVIDHTSPTVTINQAIGQADPTNDGTINFTAGLQRSGRRFWNRRC